MRHLEFNNMKIFNKGVKTSKVDTARTFDFTLLNDQTRYFYLIEGFLDFRELEEIKNG